MEFSRAIAHASFVGLFWLMGFSAILFAALAVTQHMRGEPGARTALAFGGAVAFLLLALLFRVLARRIRR